MIVKTMTIVSRTATLMIVRQTFGTIRENKYILRYSGRTMEVGHATAKKWCQSVKGKKLTTFFPMA